MERSKDNSNWSGVVKEEKKHFNLNEWPTLYENADIKNEPEIMDYTIRSVLFKIINSLADLLFIYTKTFSINSESSHQNPLTSEFPSLRSSKRNVGHKNRNKTHQLSQELSNEKPFEKKYSSKVRKRITKASHLGTFMNKKPVKVVKDIELEKLMQKIKDNQIVTFHKGRKREIPKKNVTRLKRNILRIRAEQSDKTVIFNEVLIETPLKPDVIESIENLKLESEPKVEMNEVIRNPFQETREIVQHSRQFRS